MNKASNIWVAAVAGAVLAAVIAKYLSTERGKQFLDTATSTLKDLSGKATEFAKSNLGDMVRETTKGLGSGKEKIAQSATKTAKV